MTDDRLMTMMCKYYVMSVSVSKITTKVNLYTYVFQAIRLPSGPRMQLSSATRRGLWLQNPRQEHCR